MEKIGFIGAYDKTDLIIYVAKVLQCLGKRVIVVDTTITQKAKYIVPVINPTTQYVTEFDEIDVAVGFKNIEGIKEYLGLGENQDLDYDTILVDVDTPKALQEWNIGQAKKNFFVTSFDMYSLQKGLETLAGVKETIDLEKVLFAADMLKEDDDYLNYLAKKHKIRWNENRIYFPIENGDLKVIYENHRVEKVKFKRLSVQYKDGIATILERILGEDKERDIRQAIKKLEKGV